jgi:hypothetical protein
MAVTPFCSQTADRVHFVLPLLLLLLHSCCCFLRLFAAFFLLLLLLLLLRGGSGVVNSSSSWLRCSCVLLSVGTAGLLSVR